MERDNIVVEAPEHEREVPLERSAPQPGVGRNSEEYSEPLLAHDATQEMRSRWESIQARFIDDPASVVKEADELVSAAIKRLSETFARERANLEQQWAQGKDASTEDLRLALRRYRAFFHRLLAV